MDWILGVFVALRPVCVILMRELVMFEGSLQEQNRGIVQASFEAWSAGTGSPFELLADDATWTIVGRSLGARTYASREACIDKMIRPFNARMQGGLHPKLRNIYAEGNTVVVVFDARGTARDGEPYENTYAWFLEMREGEIASAFAFFDSLAFNDLWQRVSTA
jgi:ketosteroid isomerase-like protein